MRPEAFCDCDGPPWPPMRRLHVGGLDRWHVCPRCGAVRQEICRQDGTIVKVEYHEAGAGNLPEAVATEAREILEQGQPEQLRLWEGNQ